MDDFLLWSVNVAFVLSFFYSCLFLLYSKRARRRVVLSFCLTGDDFYNVSVFVGNPAMISLLITSEPILSCRSSLQNFKEIM